jgi:hypothetical protein
MELITKPEPNSLFGVYRGEVPTWGPCYVVVMGDGVSLHPIPFRETLHQCLRQLPLKDVGGLLTNLRADCRTTNRVKNPVRLIDFNVVYKVTPEDGNESSRHLGFELDGKWVWHHCPSAAALIRIRRGFPLGQCSAAKVLGALDNLANGL